MTGNELMAMGAAFAGCKFYCAYPMSPATHILEWFAGHGKELGICVRQVEDEISVVNMTIGAGHMGVRSMCATSGGGLALMTEAIGMAGMIETPVVVVNVMRAGPSTGVPTKTEQADLNQAFGASQGDFPRIIIAPLSMTDCFTTPALAFNLAERYQCPVIILADLLMCEDNETVDPALLDVEFKIDRGELITEANAQVWRRTVPALQGHPLGHLAASHPGLPGHLYVSGTDEHDEDGVLISDVYTDPVRRKKMVDKRARKMDTVLDHVPAPKLEGPAEAEVTLVGWGSTWGVISEAVERLNQEGISANHLQIKLLVPFHVKEVTDILGKSKKISHRREQLQRPVRPPLAGRDRHRRARPHPQVRRRAFRAEAHRGWRQGNPGRHERGPGAVDRTRLADGASHGHDRRLGRTTGWCGSEKRVARSMTRHP